MCGICGIIRRSKSKIERVLLGEMTDTMLHRGPDAEGFFLDRHVGLGHRRLKIIDLEGGTQPLFNEDGTIVVIYNGEIYNFLEIKKELETKGHQFRTRCDTEVIVHAYEEYGLDCPKKFRGMFAFALYDSQKDMLFLARDRLGIKPLYYYMDADVFLFASEIKAIFKALKTRPSVNIDALDFYVSLGYVPGEETLFTGVKKLLPGHTLLLKDWEVRLEKYWDLEDTPQVDVSFTKAKKRFKQLLLESVRLRLVSDVPLGAFLSGGLDSSSVVACMSSFMKEPVKTFSVGYLDDPASSELAYAKKVSQYLHTDHYEYILRAGDFFASLDLLLEHTEEPIVESAAVALYQLSKLAREHVTVILSGEGGDEILAGYPLYRIMKTIDGLHSLAKYAPPFIRDLVSTRIKRNEKLTKYWDWIHLPLRQRYWSIPSDVTASLKVKMYREDFLPSMNGRVQKYFENLFDTLRTGSSLRKMSYIDIKSWLPDDLLLKADKMTMANSLELRVPLLDHKLLEFSTSLPDTYRLNGGQGKYLLKKVMEDFLPPEIIYRKKQGFPVPIAKWFRNDLHENVREILLDGTSFSRRYFKESYVAGALDTHRLGKEDLSRRLFSLLTLEMWHRKYID
jgi:asparagine synthase (glutamine-hydrolysing)